MTEPLIRFNETGVFLRAVTIWFQTALGVVALGLGTAEYLRFRASKTFRMLFEGSVCIFIWLMGCAILSEVDLRSPFGLLVRMAAQFCAVFYMALCVSFSARVSDIPRPKRRFIASVFYLLGCFVWAAVAIRNFLYYEKQGELILSFLLWGRLIQTVYTLACAALILWICKGWKTRLKYIRHERLRKKLWLMALAITISALVDLLLPVLLRSDLYFSASLAAFLAFLAMLNVALARKRNKLTMQNAFLLLSKSQTDVPILIIGADEARIQDCNEKAEMVLSREAGSLPGHSLEEFFDSDIDTGEWERRLRSDIRLFYCRVYLKHTRVPWQMTVYNIHDSFGEAFLGLILLQDLSGEEELLRELNRTRDAALESARLNAEFVNGMGSQMRASLKELVNLSSADARDSDVDDLSKRIDEIHTAANALLFRVNEALDYSRIDSGEVALTLAEYEPLKLIYEAASRVRSAMLEKGLEFTVCVNPALPVKLKGDSSRINQVLSILLDNAMQYTEEGFVSLSVDCENRDNGIFLQAEVTDSGIGIPQERHVKLFNEPGNLYSARKLVELMDGSINVKSSPGSGSAFTIVLPQEVADYGECLYIRDAARITTATFLKPSRADEAFRALLSDLGVRNIRCSYPPELMKAAHNGAAYIFVDEDYIESSHISAVEAPGGVTVVVIQNGKETKSGKKYRRIVLPEFGMELKKLFEETAEKEK
ncbi:MAG: PAS domain-containing sensor histidine kinase [Lachnospiraceae bacterium]|nr:PAS domain-containing sensor histidine kinase [Lachnospiraceae bacterium]